MFKLLNTTKDHIIFGSILWHNQKKKTTTTNKQIFLQKLHTFGKSEQKKVGNDFQVQRASACKVQRTACRVILCRSIEVSSVLFGSPASTPTPPYPTLWSFVPVLSSKSLLMTSKTLCKSLSFPIKEFRWQNFLESELRQKGATVEAQVTSSCSGLGPFRSRVVENVLSAWSECEITETTIGTINTIFWAYQGLVSTSFEQGTNAHWDASVDKRPTTSLSSSTVLFCWKGNCKMASQHRTSAWQRHRCFSDEHTAQQ